MLHIAYINVSTFKGLMLIKCNNSIIIKVIYFDDCFTDERVLVPVPRRKHFVPRRTGNLSAAENHWIPVSDPPLRSFNRSSGQPLSLIYVSHPGKGSICSF